MIARALLAASCAASLLHCATTTAPTSSDLAPGDAGPAPSAEAGAFEIETPLPDDRVECAEGNKQIYVLGTDRALYRFYPDKLSFDRIGQVACPTLSGTFSMAIDRRGTAWVEYLDGRLFAVDTTTAKCKPTPFQQGQHGFENFGMGYAKNGDADGGETLYVSGAGLASLDTKTFELTFLGSLTYGRTELTGRGTELFAFGVESGVIAGLNKANGATEVTYRTTAVNERAAFAFAQWGGDFWIFTGDKHSIVTQYSPATNTSKVVIQNAGMLIVGAGSSTCAPTTTTPR
ncbi:MAG: hypothetical protein KF819_05950 [Labilithrix sp.]|nr:hypothetical protein [Labilithrix sp.]